jgi:hypothetical protein
MTPHYPPLYPAVIYLVEKAFGLNPVMIKTLFVVQHLFLTLSIVYLASALKVASRAFIVSIAATAGVYFGAFAHTVATQGFEAPFLALMVGVVLRYHFEGWRLRLLPLFIFSAFGLAVTRHADVVLAIMPAAYWLLRALYVKLFHWQGRCATIPRYLGNALICWLGLAVVLVIAAQTQRLVCLRFGHDCPYSIIGRAGCYRIAKTYALVPADQRQAWIADKAAELSAGEAFAFNAMAAGGNCWSGAYANIAHSFPGENQDKLMNSAFFGFLLMPDRFSTEQMLSELRGGLHLDPLRTYEFAPVENLLFGSAFTVARDDDGMHHEMRVRLGAKATVDRSFFEGLMRHPFTIAYDWYTYYLLDLMGAAGLAILVIFDRSAGVIALGTAFAISSLAYLVSVTAVTVMLYQYELPLDFLMYVWTGILGCILMDTVSRAICGRKLS